VKSARKFLSTALALGLVAALPAAASAAPSAKHHPRAKSAGGDAPLILPSIVRVRVDRGTASMARAADYVDRDMPTKAVASLLNARRNMYAAWRGATYLIEHAPPAPPAADAAVDKRKARASGGAVAGASPYADPNTTAVAVLGLQHTVATGAYGLLDGAKGVLRDAVSTTIFAALNRRDSAIAYIAAIPPPPAADASVHRRAHASGGAVAGGGFATLMPAVVPDLDDEMQQIEGLVSGGALTPGEKRILNQADFQVFKTEQTINATWPPVPAAG
jgi:hypothetical protein